MKCKKWTVFQSYYSIFWNIIELVSSSIYPENKNNLFCQYIARIKKKNKNELYWLQPNVSMLVHDVTIFYKEFVSKGAFILYLNLSLFKWESLHMFLFLMCLTIGSSSVVKIVQYSFSLPVCIIPSRHQLMVLRSFTKGNRPALVAIQPLWLLSLCHSTALFS